jgi:O-antigen/teichoic acid export membrane protein
MLAEILKRVGRHTLVYSLGNIAARIVGFFMIPVYTHYLAPRDYGIIELLDLSSYLLGLVIGGGMSSAVLRFYYDDEDQEQKKQIISTALIFMLLFEILLLAVILSFCGKISMLVFQTNHYVSYFRMIFLTMCSGILIELSLTYIRAKQQSTQYTLFSLIQLILGLSLNICFIVVLRLGVLGVILSGLISNALMATVLVGKTLREVRINFSWARLKDMLAFGLPMIPSGIGMYISTFADRFFLQKMATLSEVGIYSLGYKLGMTLAALIVAPFFLFWTPYSFEIAQNRNAKDIFARVHVYFTFVLVFCVLGLSVFADIIVRILAPPAYWEASKIVPIIAFAYFLLGMNYFFHLGINLKKKTRCLAFAVGTSGLLNLLLNYLLIPPYQAQGAAWATLLTFLYMAGANYVFSQNLYPIKYQHLRVIKMLLVGTAILLASKLVNLSWMPLAIGLRLILVLSFPLMLMLFFFYSNEERERARTFMGFILARVRMAVSQGKA